MLFNPRVKLGAPSLSHLRPEQGESVIHLPLLRCPSPGSTLRGTTTMTSHWTAQDGSRTVKDCETTGYVPGRAAADDGGGLGRVASRRGERGAIHVASSFIAQRGLRSSPLPFTLALAHYISTVPNSGNRQQDSRLVSRALSYPKLKAFLKCSESAVPEALQQRLPLADSCRPPRG